MNPIANTLDQHKKANKSIWATKGKMAAIYKQARERLNSKLQKYVLSDPNPSNGKWMVGLINELEKNYAKLEEAFVKEMGGAIPYVAQSYYFDALSDLGNSVTGKLDKAKIELLRKDAWNHIAGMTKNMEKSDVAWLRQTAGDVFRLAGTSGMTAQETKQMLLGKILMRPEKFQFTDAGGRMWDNKTYCEMLTRTVLLNAGRQTYFDTCAENGCDVVQVTVSGNPCPDCAVWENRLLSISGNTPGLPTVAEAIAAGLCHPNCTHSFVAVGDYVREQDFTEDGRPKEGLNSPGKEEKNDKEAWSKYSAAHKPEKKPKEKPEPEKKPEPKPEAKPAPKPEPAPAKAPEPAPTPEPKDLPEGEQMKLSFGQHFRSQPLTEDEQKAVRRYSGSIYSEFNNYLRELAEHPKMKRNPDFDDMAKKLNAAIDKSVVKHDVTVYRGIGSRRIRALYEQKPPKEIPINFFQSTSSTPKVAKRFAGGNVMMIVKVPAGSHSLPMRKYSIFQRENENLLKNRGIFKVLKQYEKDGLLYLEVEYVEHH